MDNVFYRWKVACKCGSYAMGTTKTAEMAQGALMAARKEFLEAGLKVVHYSITNNEELLILAVDIRA
jgi:hypothetical protein